ncbi:hypothetical protein [Methylobacterium sp. Leaf118]|uniref:hypothetical protein n=1 Tax=Methylobacterium sp. Leaf118 TaxID=2876562 RepID=UPI001E2EE249|nr:hypothetical protein [Methylobacterium sp. Leaf118]
MQRVVLSLSLTLALIATSVLPAASRPGPGQERRAAAAAAKRPAPHWSSIGPDLQPVGVRTSPSSAGLPTIPFPGWSHGSSRCDVVVKRPGGNPTQDMTGSIGHAKSHNSNGGAGRMRVCGGAR